MSDRVAKVRQGRSEVGRGRRPWPADSGEPSAGPAQDSEGSRLLTAAESDGDMERMPRHSDQPLRRGHQDHRPVVAVTGAAHDLGLALTARLAQSERFARVVAIDDHRGDLTGVVWRVVDIRDPVLAVAGGHRRHRAHRP